MVNLGAQPGLHDHGIVEIYIAFRHMWGNPASESPVAGFYLTHDESNLA